MAASLTPEDAEEKRQAIRDEVKGDIADENFAAAADTMAENAKLLGDPIILIEAADLYAQQAEKERDLEVCEQADETTRVALDILYFYDDVAAGKQRSRWKVIDPSDATGLIGKAKDKLGTCTKAVEDAIAADEAAKNDAAVASARPVATPKPKREMQPGTGFLVGGAVAASVGLAGVGLAVAGVAIGSSKQHQVEKLDPMTDQDQISQLDHDGGRANMLAFIGAGVSVVGLAVGIPLLIVGAKKRKDGAPPANASLQVTPMFGRTASGLMLSGRF